MARSSEASWKIEHSEDQSPGSLFRSLSIYRKPINETATSTAQAERDILDLLIVVASELPVDEVAAALAVAILGVDVMLNTFLTILASASTTLVLRLSRSDWTPDGREVTHAGVERPVTGGAVAKEY